MTLIWVCIECGWTITAAANPQFCDQCGGTELKSV